MRAIAISLILAATLTLAGCAHKPGLGSYADAGVTYAALSTGDFVEANPLLSWGPNPAVTALVSIGLKQGMKYTLSEGLRVPHRTAHRTVESGGAFGAGFGAAGMLGAAGLVPFIGGFGAALWYWVWSGEG